MDPDDQRQPVVEAADLETLDTAEVIDGYMDGFRGAEEPGNNHSRSYWHGWRNGAGDRNHTADAAQLQLARNVVAARNASPQGNSGRDHS